jgi:hypothetical protein
VSRGTNTPRKMPVWRSKQPSAAKAESNYTAVTYGLEGCTLQRSNKDLLID